VRKISPRVPDRAGNKTKTKEGRRKKAEVKEEGGRK